MIPGLLSVCKKRNRSDRAIGKEHWRNTIANLVISVFWIEKRNAGYIVCAITDPEAVTS